MIASIFNNIYYLPTLLHSHSEIKVEKAFIDACRHIPHYRTAALRDRIRAFPPNQALTHFSNTDELLSPNEFLTLAQNYLKLLDENQLREFLELPEDDAFLANFAKLKAEITSPFISERHKQLLYDIYSEITNFFHRILFVLTSLANITDGALSTNTDHDSYYHGPQRNPELLSRSHAKEILTMLSSVYLLPGVLQKFYSYYIPYPSLTTPITFVSTLAILLLPGFYQRFLQKCPQEHPALKNMTAEALQKKKKPVFPREDLLNKIQDKFSTEKGVILVGDPGSGKTALVESLIWRYLSAAKDTQIFSCKANKLNRPENFGDLFFHLENVLGSYSDHLVFFIDEFHQLFETPPSNTITIGPSTAPQKMLTFANEFPFIIGATTTQEYEEIIKAKQTEAFARRFHVIHVPAMNETELKSALIYFIKNTYPHLLFEDGAIAYIIEKAKEYNPNTSPIDAAMSLMKEAARQVTATPFKKEEEQVLQLEHEKTRLGTALTLTQSHQPDDLAAYATAAANYEQKKAALDEKKQHTNSLKKWDRAIDSLHKHSFQHAKNGDLRTWLETRTLFTFAKAFVAKEKKRFGIESRVTKSVIDEIIASCQASRQALDESLP